MYLFMVINEGLRAILGHKFRSFLTMLGVILGVSALMATFALTAGLAAGFKEQLAQFGGLERIEVENQGPPEDQEPIKEISPGRTYADVQALRRYAGHIKLVSPEVEDEGVQMIYGARRRNGHVAGVEAEFFTTDQHELERGRFLTDLDVLNSNRVVVIGQGIIQDLFAPGVDPLGKDIYLNGQIFRVVGLLKRYETEAEKQQRLRAEAAARARAAAGQVPRRGGRGGGGGWRMTDGKNRTVVIPISTFQICFRTANDADQTNKGPNMKLDELNLQIKDLDRFNESVAQVREVLLKTHRGIEDFRFDTRETWFERQQDATKAARISGGFIAGISLLVGGLGITNIMLASIAERIRDIGIRRAIGAKAQDIFIQILTESALLAALGGVLGLVTSVGLIHLIAVVSPQDNAPIIEPEAVWLSFCCAVGIGLFAGIYPAFKAASLSPIQALRYE
jgi:putative ABC transport system permease protein